MRTAAPSTLAPPPKKQPVAAAPTPAPPAPVVTQAPPPPPPPQQQPQAVDTAIQTHMNAVAPPPPPQPPQPAAPAARQAAPPDDRPVTPSAPPPPAVTPTQPPQAGAAAATYDPAQAALVNLQGHRGQLEDGTYGNGAQTGLNLPVPNQALDPAVAARMNGGGGAKAGADPGAASGAAGADTSGGTKSLGQMIADSLAANPNASKGGYEGVGNADHPGPDGQQSYGTQLPQDGSQGLAPPTDKGATDQQPGKQFDWQADPLLVKARGSLLDALQKAKGATMQQKINALLAFGDPDMVKLLLGNDSPYADAAKNNQFSTVATIDHDYNQSVKQSDEDLNKQGLFYSGHRTGEVLPELGRQKQKTYSDESGKLQDALAALTQQDLGAENDYAGNVRSEEEAAFQRALDEALKYGGTGTTTAPPTGPAPGATSGTPSSTSYTPPKAGTTVKKKTTAPAPAQVNYGGVRPDDRAVGPMASNGGRAVPVKVRPSSTYRGRH